MGRILIAWLAGAVLPAAAFTAADAVYRLTHASSTGDGQLAMIGVMYLAGFVVFALLRLIVDPITAVIIAATIFIIGLPFTAAVALGIVALAPALFGLGGIVSQLSLGLSRRSPEILA